MVSSRVVVSKVFRMAIRFEYFFFLIRRQNGECNVRNFRRFLYGTRPDVLAFKVSVFTSDIEFLYCSKWIYTVDTLRDDYCSKPWQPPGTGRNCWWTAGWVLKSPLTEILLTLLTFGALPILRKISICRRWLLFGVSYYEDVEFTLWRVING